VHPTADGGRFDAVHDRARPGNGFSPPLRRPELALPIRKSTRESAPAAFHFAEMSYVSILVGDPRRPSRGQTWPVIHVSQGRIMFCIRRASSRRSRRGFAAVMAITSVIPLVTIAGTLLMVTVRAHDEFEESLIVTKARDTAASGAQDAMAKLALDADYSGSYDLAIGGATAHVVVTDWASDGIDNDGNGKVDDALEDDYVAIFSEGRVNVAFDAKGNEVATAAQSRRATANVITKKVHLSLPVEAAFYVDDPLATVAFSGSSFSISGDDVNLDGKKGPKPSLPGIGVPGDPAYLASELTKSQKSKVTGLGGTPSVKNVADIDLVYEMQHLGRLATLIWSDPNEKISNAKIGDFSKLVPVIAHAKGDLKLSGGSTGCGVLVVDGNLELSGSFDFVGVIYVAGSVTFTGGGGKKNLRGALLTPGNIAGTDGSLAGSVNLQYSSQAVDILQSKLSDGVELISWAQR
jgi:hypothetical protein